MAAVLGGMAIWSFGKIFLHNHFSSFSIANNASAIEFIGTHLTVLSVPFYFRLQSHHPRTGKIKLLESGFVLLFIYTISVYMLVFYGKSDSIERTVYGWKQIFINSNYLLPLIPLYLIAYSLSAYYLRYSQKSGSFLSKRNPLRILFAVLSLIFAGSLFFSYLLPLFDLPWFPELGNVLCLVWAFFCPFLIRRYSVHLEPLTAADTLIENLPDPLIIADSSYRIVKMNNSAHKAFGHPDITGGSSFKELLPSGKENLMVEVTAKDVYRYESVAKSVDGRKNNYSVSVTPTHDTDGTVTGFVSIAHDISQQKKMEDRLRAQTEILSQANIELESKKNLLSVTLHQMESAVKAMHSDLDAARHMQRLLLPEDLSGFTGIRLAPIFRPSESVGGDLYDVCRMSDGSIALIVFDVAGHGVAAALYAAVAKTIFERRLDPLVSPGETLRKINNDLYKALGGELFLAGFLGHLNPETMMLNYSLAAFPFPLLFKKNTGELVSLSGRGAFIGMTEDDDALTTYEDNCIFMDHGDRFIIFSDGITEARKSDGSIWGTERLRKVFTEGIEYPPSTAVQMILAEQEKFSPTDSASDDRTTLMVEMV
ncbi:MAG: SpoIIE family protein phosphatase [Fibrobacteres bacterium]|nr:SpoIIE family protein phosphatase [Fibrobacterota bacterium]